MDFDPRGLVWESSVFFINPLAFSHGFGVCGELIFNVKCGLQGSTSSKR